MPRLLSKVFFVLILTTHLQAQDATVTGLIINENNEPVSYATVAVYDSIGENLLTGTQADEEGYFSLALEQGSYLLNITVLSYHSFENQISLQGGEEHDLGEITLQLKSENLDDINIEGERSHMELDFDRRVFQVGSDVTTVGASALDVLDNIPSISTDIEGNISLRGSDGVRILINGKPSSAYSNGSGALRGLSANMIEEVQVITNPSARYEAEGSVGIINIILKKNEEAGFNGSVAAGAGYPRDYEASANLNYRKNRINWFMNTNLNYRSDPSSSRSFQRYFSPDTSYMYRENSDSEEWEIDGTFRLGADIQLPLNQTLTTSATMDLEQGEEETQVRYLDMLLDETVIQDVRRNDLSEQDENDYEFEVSYENQFNGREHRITADFDIDYSREEEFSELTETVVEGASEPILQQTNNEESELDYRFRADYENEFSEDSKIEAGINASMENLENEFTAEEFRDGEWIRLNNFVDNFTYKEIVNAVYGSYSAGFGKFSTQVGLRLEQTVIDTKLLSTGEGSRQNYLKLFPSMFLNYSFSEEQSVQVSYSRRIRRPWSRMLLPYTSFTDSRNRSTGNPNLRPQFANSFEAGFLQYWETGSLLSSIYYRRTTDEFERITILDDEGITRRFPINLSTENSWGIEFAIDQDLFETITLNANVNFYRSESSGQYEDQDFSSSIQSLSGRLGLRWDISDKMRYQLYTRYRGPRNTTQGSTDANATVNTGLAYEMFKGKAVASLNVRDLLNSRNSLSVIDEEFYYSERERTSINRSFMFTFTWYFNRSPDRQRGSGGGYNEANRDGDDF